MFKATNAGNKYVIACILASLILSILIYGYSLSIMLIAIPVFIVLFWFGHGLGQHRYLSHNQFKLNRLWHYIIVTLATLVSFGSPLGWAVLHKAHHRYSGTDKDTYLTKNPFKVFFCVTAADSVTYKDAKGLDDWYVLFTHKYYLAIILLFNGALFTLSTTLWQIYTTAVVYCCAAFVWTWVIAHKKFFFSYQNFKDESYNDIFCGYVLGEWHNNHHAKPGACNQKVKWWEFDILYHIIRNIRKDA